MLPSLLCHIRHCTYAGILLRSFPPVMRLDSYLTHSTGVTLSVCLHDGIIRILLYSDYLLGQLLLSQYTWQGINRIIGRKHVISDTIGGAVFITTSGDTAISAGPLHHYQQQQLIEHEWRLFIGPEMRVASWVVHRVVCLFLLGQRVYKLHYSKVKDKRREKRTHIHTRAQIMGYSLNVLPFCQLHQIVLVLLRCRFPNLCEYS